MSSFDWIFNILDGKKEVEDRVFENEHFMLQPDTCDYNQGDILTLHLLALPKIRTCKTIRDLRAEHLPLLRSIQEESYKAIEEKFGLPS